MTTSPETSSEFVEFVLMHPGSYALAGAEVTVYMALDDCPIVKLVDRSDTATLGLVTVTLYEYYDENSGVVKSSFTQSSDEYEISKYEREARTEEIVRKMAETGKTETEIELDEISFMLRNPISGEEMVDRLNKAIQNHDYDSGEEAEDDEEEAQDDEILHLLCELRLQQH